MRVPGDVQATFAATLVDEWVRCGVAHAVLAPGSRSTPLALALGAAARAGRLDLHVRVDERSAGFLAVGLGLATGGPAVVVTTSGTAAVELHPAVVEAHQSRVPVIACTADRPAELHHVGAPQTVEQVDLYGEAVRFAVAPGVPDPAGAPTWRSLGARLVAEAVAGPAGPGPVHANLAFREPLVGRPGPLPRGRPAGDGWHRVSARAGPPPGEGEVAELAAWAGRRGVVVAGAGAGDPRAVHALGRALGWPVLADPRSGARVAGQGTVAAADALLRCPAFARSHRPEVVLRLGAPWASKALDRWLRELPPDVDQVLVDPWWAWADPGRSAGRVVVADPTALARAVTRRATPAGDAWAGAWRAAEETAQSAIAAVLADHREPTEPGVARAVAGALPEGARLVVASSMPVRDLEWFAPPLPRPPRVVANRGANGIDGTVATALGVAVGARAPTVALLGDLAFLHDAGSLLGASSLLGGGSGLTLVVVDNGGGGIFSFLPQARELQGEEFEELFATPQQVDLTGLASAYGAEVDEVCEARSVGPGLADAVAAGGLRLLRVRTDRAVNVAVHEELHHAVGAALAEAGLSGPPVGPGVAD